ncbi:MAG TPA: hypothetical protein VHK24_00955, partial [Steroidobacter sp.]|nr:hypothetical protein [Steroidobacter sp.]
EVILGVAAAFAAGCARQQTPAPRDEAQPAAAPVAQVDAAADQAPSAEPSPESGLSIKRGVATLAHDRTTFRPCNERAELWVLDQTDDALARIVGAHSPRPTTLYIEAYGERTSVDELNAAARSYAGAFVLEEVLYAGLQDAVMGCAEAPADYILAAGGAEPLWAVEVHDEQLVWRQSEEPKQIRLGAPQAQDAEGAVRYRASSSGHEVEVLIDAQACRDVLSDEFFAYTAKALFDGREFNGCARVGR